MIAYLLMFLLCIYVALSIFFVRFVVKKANKFEVNSKVSMIIAIIVVTFPFTYMTIEYFLTKSVYNNYCTKEAGVWIYKTGDQWKKENPGVAETLKAYTDKNRPGTKAKVKKEPDERIGINQYLNPRFIWVSKETGPKTNVFKHTDEIIDVRTGEVMARWIDFSSGYGNPFLSAPYGLASYKVWLAKDKGPSYDKNFRLFFDYLAKIKNIGDK